MLNARPNRTGGYDSNVPGDVTGCTLFDRALEDWFACVDDAQAWHVAFTDHLDVTNINIVDAQATIPMVKVARVYYLFEKIGLTTLAEFLNKTLETCEVLRFARTLRGSPCTQLCSARQQKRSRSVWQSIAHSSILRMTGE